MASAPARYDMWFRFKSVVQFLSLMALDLLAYYVCLFLAVFFQMNLHALMNFTYIIHYTLPNLFFTVNYMYSIGWMPVVLILVMAFEKLYMVRYPFWEESRVIFKAATIAVTFIVLTVIVRNMYGNVSRSVFVYLWFFLVFALPVIRYFGKKILYRIGIWKESVLIIGAGDKAVRTILGLSNEEHLGYHILGLLDDDPKKIGTSVVVRDRAYKVYGKIRNFDKFVSLLRVETVFIANPTVSQQKLTDLVSEIYKHVKRVIIVPDIKGVAIFNSELHYLFMEKLFMIKVKNNLNSVPNLLIKRAFDIVLSLAGMVVLLPVMAVLAVIIKSTSRGPAFYSHKRIGKGGKEFRAFKFRTMYQDSEKRLMRILQNPKARREWRSSFKLRKDPRVTPIGRFLRQTSLDELPQFFNILKGDMSLVGPRPVTREELDRYYANYKSYYCSVYPGLSGLWQVSGRSDKDYTFRIQTDVWYVQNWSVWLDIIIILKTFPVVFKREGAY